MDGENVEDSWPYYSFFADSNVIRNYFGNVIGHEVSFKVYLVYFLTSIMVPYLLLYILENMYRSLVYVQSNFIKLVLMGIAFRVYITLWANYEDDYVDKFSDQISSKMFLSEYRGPYVRNLVSDELNEYGEEPLTLRVAKNVATFVILVALLVVVGAIFFGCRMFLLAIFDSMAGLTFQFFSVPHLLAYLLFFLFVDFFQALATDRVIKLLILLKNPASDEQSREIAHGLRFYYLLGIELIAPFFLLILEPFLQTSCYSKNCIR